MSAGAIWVAWQIWRHRTGIIPWSPDWRLGGMEWRPATCPSCGAGFEYEWVIGGWNRWDVVCPFCGAITGLYGTGRVRI